MDLLPDIEAEAVRITESGRRLGEVSQAVETARSIVHGVFETWVHTQIHTGHFEQMVVYAVDVVDRAFGLALRLRTLEHGLAVLSERVAQLEDRNGH